MAIKSKKRGSMGSKTDNRAGQVSFFPLFVIVIALSVILSFISFSPSDAANFFFDKIGLSANMVSDVDDIGIERSSLLAQSQGSTALRNPLGTNGTLSGFLNKLLDVIIMLGSIVIVFMIILAGLRYVLARGNDEEIKKAHQQLTWTAVGAAILLGAKVISLVITNTVRTLSQ